MNTIDKHVVAARFGASAATYESVTPVQAAMATCLLTQIQQVFSDTQPKAILELGCGTGRLTRQLHQYFPDATITAVDISPEMVHYAQQQEPYAIYHIVDAEEFVQSTDQTYDLIISNATIQWFENPQESMESTYKLLNKNGFLAIATFSNATFCELAASFNYAYQTNEQDVKQHVVPLPSPAEWQSILPNATLVEDKIVKTFPDVRSFLRSIQQAGAVNSLAKREPIAKQIYKSMVDYYTKHYTLPDKQSITATYHICYGFYQPLCQSSSQPMKHAV